MSLNAYPQQRLLWPAPESIPRQKAYTYIFLICLTTLLIYFYSYPLNMENWSYSMQKNTPDTDPSYLARTNVSDLYVFDLATEGTKNLSYSTFLQKLFVNISGITSTSRQLKSTQTVSNETSRPVVTLGDISVPSTVTAKPEFEKIESVGISTGAERDPNKTYEAKNEPVTVGIKRIVTKESESETSVEPDTSSAVKEISPTTTINGGKNTNEASTKTSYVTQDKKENNPFLKATSPKYKEEYFTNTSKKRETENVSSEVPTTARSSSHTTEENISVQEDVFIPTTVNDTSVVSSGVHNGFLVFSQQCRIPDLDPMHPSILHLIEKNPPLDCSQEANAALVDEEKYRKLEKKLQYKQKTGNTELEKHMLLLSLISNTNSAKKLKEDYKPLTRTERNILILNETAALKMTADVNFTCCYRSVFRKNDGISDDDVGFGKECIRISKKTIIKDEFIKVECKYHNGTSFYTEFHSFIFDKPKVEKRCSKHKNSQYSVLIIGVDGMSRINMHRQLNATAAYMLKEMGAVEMFGFNKVGDNTFPNLIPLLVGYDEKELPSTCWKSPNLPLDRCNFLWKRFSAKGYRTFYAEDSPHISSFNYVKEGFLHQPTDYYFRHFILAYEDALGRDKPLNCYLCVGSISETEAVLHWTRQFASHFAKRPYFAFSWINSLTHDFLNMGSSGDHMYKRFFKTLHRTGALNKTIVIFMGDHGMRWGDIRNTFIGRLEERLPMLLVALPEDFKREYPKFSKILKENSRRLVTPFDLHATLAHLLDLADDWSFANTDNVDENLSKNFTRRAHSLFQDIPEDRSCDDAFIEEHWCTCESSLETDIESDEVKRVAVFLLDRLNSLLKTVSNQCALLTLDSVSDARLWQPPSEHKGHSASDNIYTVVIRTNPGKAVFEGTVKLSQQKREELLGAISRLNLYGDQSSCINNAVLKKYCYCL